MAINTSAGNEVKFLGLSSTLRASLLKAILGNSTDGKVTVNTAKVCYVGLSKTDPGTSVSEPNDANYTRIKIGETPSGSGATWKSDFLTITGAKAVNSGVQKEIKFNRSLGAWTDSYPYFFLADAVKNGNIMAWGKMTEPVTVGAKNVVPLFEEDKFRLYFPDPSEVEGLVDDAAEADTEPTA